MSTKEIKKLIDLAKQQQREMTKEKAMSSLVAAGILDIQGDFTEPYKNLETLFTKQS